MKYFCKFVILLISLHTFSFGLQLLKLRDSHTPHELTPETIQYISKLSNISHVDAVLDNILFPRVVGTENHKKVADYITNELSKLGWHVEIDQFQDNVPKFGSLTFHNIIGSLNPEAERFLVFACHYDSKFFNENDFVGATDSAVPCAMILNLITVMKNELEKNKKRNDVSLKLIFLDGEEAFVSWTPKDSIYGARHLAKKWDRNRLQTKSGETVSNLQRIDLFVLLDLLGAPNPLFYSFFENTARWYLQLVSAEERLSALGLLQKDPDNPYQTYFMKRTSFSQVEDDHLPFLRKNVPILHLIPIPFPREWHTPEDNRDLIDLPTVENLNKILRVFTAEYLQLA